MPQEGETTVDLTLSVEVLFSRGSLQERIGEADASGAFDVSLGEGLVTDGELVYRMSGYVEERKRRITRVR